METITEENPAASAISYEELYNINLINQAVLEDKSLEKLGQVFLESLASLYSIKGCRLYTINNEELNLVCENFEQKTFELIEKKLRIKIKRQIPSLQTDNYMQQLIRQRTTIITSDPEEVKQLVESHATNPFVKTFATWSIKLIGLKTFALVPLINQDEMIGLVTFVSSKVFTEEDRRSFHRFTKHISTGLEKKIWSERLIFQKELSQNLLDILPIDVAVLDKNNRYRLINKQAMGNGDLRSWIIGKTDMEYCIYTGKPIHIAEKRKEKLREIEKNGKPLQWIEDLTDQHNNQHHLLRILKPITIEGEQYKLGYGLNVTDLIHTQEQLKETQRIGKLVSWELKTATNTIVFGKETSELLNLDYNPEGIPIKQFYAIIDDKYRRGFIDAIQQLYLNKKIDNYEIGILLKNKELHYFHLNAIATTDAHGEVQKVMGTLLDITSIKTYEARLNEKQQLLLTSQAMAKMGSWEVNFVDLNDWSKNITRWSDESYRIFGYEPGSVEVSYPFFMQHVHPEDQHLVALDFKKLLMPGSHHEDFFRIILKDGTVKHLHGKFYIQFDEYNTPVKMIGMTQDVTEQKQSELLLKKSEAQLSIGMHIAKLGYWEYNVDEGLFTFNDEFYSMLRTKSTDVGGYKISPMKYAEMFLPPDEQPVVATEIEKALNTSDPAYSGYIEHRIMFGDGEVGWISVNFYIVKDNQGRTIKTYGVNQDITHKKKLENELAGYNQKLKEEIDNQTRELILANQNLDAFNYSISHDLKTPIRGIEIYTELLKETIGNDPESLDCIENLQKGIKEIKQMISDLLNFSKYSKVELNKINVDMNMKIQSCIQSFNTNEESKVKFSVVSTPSVYADDHLLSHVLDNLISNAVKYSSKKENPFIEISGKINNGFTTYYIKDNGDGFDQKLSYKLFKPFSRLHNESEFDGSGAGLAIVERIISRHGGKIWAESEKGNGATFYFQFPNPQ